MRGRILFALISAAGFAGCYVESVDDRAPQSGDAQRRIDNSPLTDDNGIGTCRTTVSKGCFDGHIVSKAEFFVDGKQFFNADDLATRFKDLVRVEDKGQALTADQYQLALVTAVDNNAFVSGFEYYLRGEIARLGKMRNTGDFNINELPEGTYDLRVQKPIKFQVLRTVARQPEPQPQPQPQPEQPLRDDAGDQPQQPEEPSQPGQPEQPSQPAEPQQPAPAPEPTTETLTTSYCATLFTDVTVDVRKGKRTWDTFSDFRLYVMDADCPEAGWGHVLSVDH